MFQTIVDPTTAALVEEDEKLYKQINDLLERRMEIAMELYRLRNEK